MTAIQGRQASQMEPVVRRLAALSPMSLKEAALLRGLIATRSMAQPGEQLISPGAPATKFLLRGWAACQVRLPDGRRQILRLLTPGDALGEAPHLSPPNCEVTALTQVTTAEAGPAFAAAAAGEAPGLARALALAGRLSDGHMAHAVLRLGCLSAYERVAHLLLELCGRLEAAGLGDNRLFPLPITQETLADTLGLSIVHTNRVLQKLRREKLIELRSGVAVLLDRPALTRIAHAGAEPAPLPIVRSFAAGKGSAVRRRAGDGADAPTDWTASSVRA